jgi:hypothetical protein
MATHVLEQMSRTVNYPHSHPFSTRFLSSPSISKHCPPPFVDAIPYFYFTRMTNVPRHQLSSLAFTYDHLTFACSFSNVVHVERALMHSTSHHAHALAYIHAFATVSLISASHNTGVHFPTSIYPIASRRRRSRSKHSAHHCRHPSFCSTHVAMPVPSLSLDLSTVTFVHTHPTVTSGQYSCHDANAVGPSPSLGLLMVTVMHIHLTVTYLKNGSTLWDLDKVFLLMLMLIF